jgi:hypothetical protein
LGVGALERAIFDSKIKQFWNYAKIKIMHGKVLEIRKLFAQGLHSMCVIEAKIPCLLAFR